MDIFRPSYSAKNKFWTLKYFNKMVKEGEKLVKQRLKFWKVPVTPLLDELLEKAIEHNAYVSKSDFIREAVREKLQRMGLMES